MALILTVDDSFSIRSLVAETLLSAGHEVVQAKDGFEGLAKATASKVDLVISDVNMPGMDGITLVKRLREVPGYRFVPLLILTTELDPAKKLQAKNAGATGWLVKPFNPAQLLATIRKVID